MLQTLDIKIYTFSAGQTIRCEIPGNLLHIFEASTKLKVNFDDGQAQLYLQQSSMVEREYRVFSLYSEFSQTVILHIGYGKLADSRSRVNVEASPRATSFASISDVTIVANNKNTILPANPSRLYAMISSKNTNIGFVRIGANTDISATTGAGMLKPNSTTIIDATCEISGYQQGATNAILQVTEGLI